MGNTINRPTMSMNAVIIKTTSLPVGTVELCVFRVSEVWGNVKL
jgi:hypothetical protein